MLNRNTNDITIIGAAIIDALAGPADANIIINGSTPMENIRMSFGGDALNEAVVLSHLGLTVELRSKVGNDEAGKQVLGFLKKNRVHTKIKEEDVADIVCLASMCVSPLLDIPAMKRYNEMCEYGNDGGKDI